MAIDCMLSMNVCCEIPLINLYPQKKIKRLIPRMNLLPLNFSGACPSKISKDILQHNFKDQSVLIFER